MLSPLSVLYMCKDIEKNLLIYMCLSVDKSRTKPYSSTPNKHHLQVVSYLWVGIYEKKNIYSLSQWEDSKGKGFCFHAWLLEFYPRTTWKKERRNSLRLSLISTHAHSMHVDMGGLSVCCEHVLLLLVNKAADLVNNQPE